MGILLIVSAFLILLLGIIGSIVPAVPGLVFAYLSLWMAKWSGFAEFSSNFMWIMLIIGMVIFVLDYFLPPLIVKKAGGSKYATWGSVIGMLIGIVFTSIGMIAGMFLGAFIGELIYTEKSAEASLKAALGAFVGFLLGTGMKLLYCFYILYKIIVALIFS